jgi:hypothetical protein
MSQNPPFPPLPQRESWLNVRGFDTLNLVAEDRNEQTSTLVLLAGFN